MSIARTDKQTINDNDVADYWITRDVSDIMNFFWSLRRLGVETRHLQQIFSNKSPELSVFVSLQCGVKPDPKAIQKLMESSNRRSILFHAAQCDTDTVRHLLASYGDKFTVAELSSAFSYILDKQQPDLITLLWQQRCKAVKHHFETHHSSERSVFEGEYVNEETYVVKIILPSLKKAVDKKIYHAIETILDTSSANVPFDVLQQCIHRLLENNPEGKIFKIMRYLSECGTTTTDKKQNFMALIIFELIKTTNDSSKLKTVRKELDSAEQKINFFKSFTSMLWDTSGSILWNKITTEVEDRIRYLDGLSCNNVATESVRNSV